MDSIYNFAVCVLLLLILSALHLSVNAGVYEPLTKWRKQAISVCFVTKEAQLSEVAKGTSLRKYAMNILNLDKQKRDEIKELVQKEYNRADTGIEFTGWEVCEQSSKSDVYFIPIITDGLKILHKHRKYKKPPQGKATIGNRGILRKNTKEDFTYIPDVLEPNKPFVMVNFAPFAYSDKLLAYEDLIPFIIIHEFGHLLSLRHEHIREEALEDRHCAGRVMGEAIGKSAKIFGAYDEFSIMNYCYMSAIKHHMVSQPRPELSVGDKETLRNIYQ